MWYRIFGANDVEPDHAAILEYLNRLAEVRGRFQRDNDGWFHADLVCGDVTLSLDRYTPDEDGIRAALNNWATVVEAFSVADPTPLMERLIQTRQLFPVEGPEAGIGRLLCTALCKHLAQATDGVYQIDGDGIFATDGTRLLSEPKASGEGRT